MSAQWTPGPWRAEEHDTGTAVFVGRDRLVADVFTSSEDAELIAAAPDLYEALRTLIDTLAPWLTTADAGLPAVVRTIGDCADLHNAQRAARAALARADGGVS